ncbi:hypothetical protein O3P69_007475 [Scylla paramamosain]|uniref:Uncharacterized protein n=1 Tax=Scylla paramamosain TaxID=85552 RepID=A0AAW0V3N4_SCYPA
MPGSPRPTSRVKPARGDEFGGKLTGGRENEGPRSLTGRDQAHSFGNYTDQQVRGTSGALAWCPLKEGLSDWPTLSPAPPSRACPHPPHAHSTPITTHRHNTLLFACGHKARVPAHTRPYVPAPRGASHLTLIHRSVLEGRRLEGEGEMNTALHWAAKQGRTEVVKLLAGTHHVEINARSGYTPLHIAAMYNRTEVFDLLVHYGADLNMRDYSGKKPRTYNTIASTVSQDTQRSKYDKADHAGLLRGTHSLGFDSHPSRRSPSEDYHRGGTWHVSLESRLDRAKRVGSKRFQRIKKSLTMNAYDKPLTSPVRRHRPLSDLFPEEDGK